MEDMKMKVYPLDSSASAVILFDYGVSNNSNFIRHTRIKILKEDGFRLGNVEIPLYHSKSLEERLINLKAITYNFDGGKIIESKPSDQGSFKEKFNLNFNIKKFAMSAVKIGSIIEYSYEISSPFISIPSWQFQQDVPTRFSEYWAMVPAYVTVKKNMQGYIPVSSYDVIGKDNYHWILQNIPAFKKEPFMTTDKDYVSKINIDVDQVNIVGSTGHISIDYMSSWTKMNKNLLTNEDFGKLVSGSNFLRDNVDQIINGVTDSTKKVIALSNYVKQTFEWDGSNDLFGESLKKVVEKKKGSSGDLNLLLGSMLDKAGFEVEMVVLSTRDHGIIRQSYPSSRQFNYSICSIKLGGKTLLLDATEKYLPYDVLPTRCLNGQGLLISKTNSKWIELSSKAKEKTFTNADFVLNDAGLLDGKINYTCDGYDAQRLRSSYFAKGEEMYSKDFLSGKQWTVVKSEFKDMKEIDKSAKIFYEINTDEHATSTGDVIYINPFVTSRLKENPFRSEKREYPVDYGNKKEEIYNCKITVPEGFLIDEIPKSKVIALPQNAAKFIYNVVRLDNAISITSNFQINKTQFIQTEYPSLREFYNQVVAIQAEQIVLKKK